MQFMHSVRAREVDHLINFPPRPLLPSIFLYSDRFQHAESLTDNQLSINISDRFPDIQSPSSATSTRHFSNSTIQPYIYIVRLASLVWSTFDSYIYRPSSSRLLVENWPLLIPGCGICFLKLPFVLAIELLELLALRSCCHTRSNSLLLHDTPEPERNLSEPAWRVELTETFFNVLLLADWANGGYLAPSLSLFIIWESTCTTWTSVASFVDFITQVRGAGEFHGRQVMAKDAVLSRIAKGLGAYMEGFDGSTSSETIVLTIRLKYEWQAAESLDKVDNRLIPQSTVMCSRIYGHSKPQPIAVLVAPGQPSAINRALEHDWRSINRCRTYRGSNIMILASC
ncbi:hypothetical protein An08g06880 [Aspergillus niger]|uniref:Uncharacterized protein n=2 Tax=Aspergillus niger TaxID=5061 RepID=A2QRQ7_ASPNC|nr:hypothetical protein An08g06880 [Aspergillus niger]CAK45658.1 hypothetical protein An08g06880 [Aspergillus niger]